jgi:Dolichyl-phosphate-mannose-protein mannosyltransferase
VTADPALAAGLRSLFTVEPPLLVTPEGVRAIARAERVTATARTALAWAAGGALVLGGATLSFRRLEVPTWNVDEYLYAKVGDQYARGSFGANPEQPPLWKELIGLSRAAFGETLWAARFPAAVAMLLTGVLLWWWLSRVGPAGAGAVAALLWWTLPAPISYPETDQPDVWVLRFGMLDAPAGELGMAAVVAGWWWIRSGRLRAAAVCGLLAGLAVATKAPAALVAVVPAVAGVVAVAFAASGVPRRIGRMLGHGALWTVAAAVGFALPYLPMGRAAPVTFRTGWEFQRRHGATGHVTLIDSMVTARPPWWSFAWWQYAAVGAAAAAVLVACTVVAVAGRPRLGSYLTAAWLVPMLLLMPAGRVGMPAYIQLWRPELVAGVALGAAVAVGWAGARIPRPEAVTATVALVAAAVLVAAPATAAVGRTEHLAPSGYAALPALVPRGTIWIVGYQPSASLYVRGRFEMSLRGTPAAIAIHRSVAVRAGTGGRAERWARAHGYRLVRSGVLDVWLRPGG